MLNRSVAILLTVTIAAHVYGAILPRSHGRKPMPLLDSVNVVAKGIRTQQTVNNAASTTPEPAPGKLNVCDNLCPKWCQKAEGLDRNFTNCHYFCGNLCNEKTWAYNPFIGNVNFEVVPSEYDFARYDLNEDKLISIEEFARTEAISPDEVRNIFDFSDFNKDGFIDTDEFHGGPLVFTVQMAAELSAITWKEHTKITTS